MHTNPRKFRKVIAGILLICLLGFVSLGVFVPQSAHAQLVVTDPSLLGKNIAAWVKQGWEKFRDNALALAYKNLLGTFLQQMAYDAATFIASGGQGQDSLVYSKPAGEYFRDLGDAAAGSAIEGFAEGMGFSQGLCMPPDDLLQIDIAYGLMTQFGSSPPPGPACTLSELAGNWSEAFADPEFETFINLYYDPQSNNLGNALAATTHIMETVATEEDNAKWQRLYEGGQFQSVTEDVSGWIQTPSSMIQQQILSTQAAEENKWGQYTGSILADTAGVFLNTLTSKLLQRLKDGMFNTVSGSSLASLMAGSTGGQVAGVTAAEEVYASLNKPSFIATGVYNVMNDFITCPPDPEQATIYNCVIGSSMQSAIDSRWTVQEYIDYLNDNGVTYKFAQDNISSPEEGLSVRAVTILKKFRVVPVGWQIAAEYVNSEIRLEEQSEYTLPQVMDAYDDCGSDPNSGNAYSPLCKLVDPYWVLKAPENYCGRESWTSDILYESFSDTDANPNTQEALELTRDTACVDERACIKENADGSCSAYGYCTEERRTYLFEGEACEEQNSSCQSFLTEDNEIASYLKNTINQDDCATNPGCKWYCQYTDTMGNFLCVDEDTVYETCNENSIDYVNDDGCVCDDTTTCEVPVNSGTNPQTGVLCVEGNDPDCNNTCLSVTPTPTLCELDDNCGADYPTFNPDTGTCTCTLTDDCEADIGDSSCDVVWGESCAIDGGACTEDSETYESIEYCTCTDPNDNTQACNIGMGDYFCDLDAGGQCYFPTTTEQPAVDDPLVPDLEDPDAPGFVWDIAINFDNDLESCDEDDATCNLYYRMVEGTNILPNAQFDYYEGNLNDNSSDFFGYCAENGSGCNDNASCVNGCNGWINSVNAQAIDISFNSDLSPEYGETAIYVPAGSGTLTNTIDTGRSVSNRTFTAAMRVMAFDDCVFEYSLSDDDGNHNSTYTDDNTYNLDANPGTWAGVTKTVTFPDNSNLGDGLTLSFNQCPGAEIALDLAQIEEADSFSAYSAYGESSASYLVQDELLECDMDDVGCELYTPVVGREEDAIPGLVTNPKSDVCTDGAYLPFQNPSCSQCPESQVGCDFYQEQPLTNITPLVDPSHGLGSERAGIIERTGYYCEDDMAQSCYDSSDCGGSACVPDLSLIPSSGQTCPAAQVGCEEYTNLDEVSAGGEGLEYYSYIRQCVKPDDTDIKTFYTWVGSDIAGYQLQSYLLKEAGDGTPCTVLDPGETDFNAGCYNNVIAANDCTAEFGIDPDCRQYYDANANVSYRYESEVVYVDEECTPMRAVLDDRTYYSIPTQSTTCSENNVGCREYKGTDAGNVEYLIDATFSGNITTGWENAESTSSEAIVQGDYSLSLSTSNPPITYELFTDVNGNISGTLEPGGSYMLTFWSKDGGGGGKIITGISGAGPTQYFTDNGSTTDINEADMGVTEDWRYYEFGPIILPADASVDDGDEFYFIENNAGDGYVDNIQLTTSSSQFLIKGSFITCSGYEGCRAYTDRAGDAHYLKSFIRLCREDMVGCEVLIDTFNSTNPFTQMWNTENEFQLDNVLVPHDMPKSYVYNPDAACIASSKGCTAMGLPELDMQTDFVDGYDTLYRLNDPDIYDELLCEEHQLQCEAYTSDFDGTMYFKNPGNKTCDWLQDDNGTFDWYKTGTDFEACPVRYEYDLPSQPIGSICNTNSGTKTGDFCTADGDCSPSDGSADSNQYPPRCISNLAEEVGIQGDLGYSDFGWVGNCAEDDSGCTTYNDSSSPNVTELIYNSSFEDDVRENTNNTYYEVTSDDPSYDSVRDHLPDYWSDPAGACPIENFIENTDEFFAGSKSLFLNDCTVYTANTIPVDRDKLYNLDGWFKGESDNFDLGLEYYDTNGALIESDDEVFATGQNYIPNNQFDQQTTYWDFSNYFGCIKWLGAQGYAQSGASFGYTMSYIQGTGCNITSDQFEVPSGEILEISAYMTPVGNTAEVFLGVSCYNDDFTDFNCVQHFETLAPNSWSEVSVTLGPPGSVAAGLADYETILSPMNRIEVRGGSGPGSNPANAPYLVAVDNFAVRTTNTYQSYQNDIAAQGASITTDDDWTYYYAHVGPGSINEFPAGTVSVRPYIANNSSADLYSDETSFKEVDQYHYLDYTVDGTQEHAQATGNSTCTDIDTDQGEINSGGGCVGFQDVLYYTENLHPQLQGECVQCVDGINDSDCYNLPNACNANSILKVTPDRVCNEWVACRTARVVENSDGTSEYTCFDLDQCTGMDDEGRCNDWDEKPAYSELSSETDLTFTTSAENNTDLDLMQNLTGYVKAGMVWPDLLMCVGGINAGDVCTTNTQCEDIGTCEFSPDDIISHSPPQAALAGFRCSGGSNNGDTCDPADLDACIGTDDGVCSAALQVEGYYPYGWMPEVGEDGVQSGDPLILGGDFEDLYCSGNDADLTMPCILDRADSSLLAEFGLDDTKGQCWLSEFEDWELAHGDGATPQYVCANSPNKPDYYDNILLYSNFPWVWPFEGWSGLLGDEQIRIWQYDNAYDPPNDVRVDINNVLQVAPTEGDYNSGVKYDLTNKIAQDGEYTLSLDARYVTAPGANETVNIGFRHENGEYDYFLKGNGMVDLVVLIDNTTNRSGSGIYDMSGAISKMSNGIGNLKDQLEVAGVDTKIAVVGLGGNDINQSCPPGDELCLVGGCPSDTDNDYLQKDFTNNISDVEGAIDTINGRAEEECTNEPYGLWQSLASALDSPPIIILGQGNQPTFRNDAKKFFILLTNSTAGGANKYTEAQDLLVQSETPLFVITMNADVSVPGVNQAITRNPFDYYTEMANASGGNMYDDLANIFYHNGSAGPLFDIGNRILDRLDIFQFSTDLETYTFGPIRVEGKEGSPNDDTELVIASSGTNGFQIDNVSLLPTLEVNKSLDTIARTCRAYPAEDAPYCSYTRPNGQIYRGWKGYCLEIDPENQNRCITWWPLDLIAGESDLFTKVPAGYSGRSSVYYCQVAKGYADVGFCANSNTTNPENAGLGPQCEDDGQCNTGICNKGHLYDDDGTTGTWREEFNGSCENDTGSSPSYALSDNCQQFPSITSDAATTDTQLIDLKTDYGLSWSCPATGPPWDTSNRKCAFSLSSDGVDMLGGIDQLVYTDIPCSTSVNCTNDYYTQSECINNNTCNTCIIGTCKSGSSIPDDGVKYCDENQDCQWDQDIDWSGDYQSITREWNTPDPRYQGNGKNSGVLVGMPANSIEGNINISELAKIQLNTGNAGGGGDNYKLEKELWGQRLGGRDANPPNWQYAHEPIITDLALGKIPEQDADAGTGPWNHCEFLQSGGVYGMGCYQWSQVNSNPTLGNDDFYDMYFVYGYSNFKRETVDSHDCNTGSSGDDSLKQWRWGKMEADPGGSEDWFNSPCIDPLAKRIMGWGESDPNPFNHLNTTWQGFNGRNFLDTSEVQIDSFFTTSPTGGSDYQGGNVFATYLDYDAEGYLTNIYYLIWYGANNTEDDQAGVELTYEEPMAMTYFMRESCAVIGEAVDSVGGNIAWAGRASNGGGYDTAIPYPWEFSTEKSPYASISPVSYPYSNAAPDEWDFFPDGENVDHVTTFGPQPSFVQESNDYDGGRPYSCIGDCNVRVCGGTTGDYSTTCDTDSDCGNDGECIGAYQGSWDGSGQGYGPNNFNDQRSQAAERGAEVLRHVFANMETWYYYTPGNATGGAYTIDTTYLYWGDPDDYYLTMGICDNNERPDNPGDQYGPPSEYCGVRPVVEHMYIDGRSASYPYYEIDSGQMIELSFTSVVDEQQLPLKYIEINWGDGEDTSDEWNSASGEHIYNHAYTCTPELDAVDGDDNFCKFTIDVTLVDNWDWCSGDDHTENNDADYRFTDGTVGEVFSDCGSGDYMPFSVGVPE